MKQHGRGKIRIAIIGTVGLPANYGGFETLADNLVRYAEKRHLPCEIEVYCSARSFPQRLRRWHGAILRYIPLNANGAASPLYDLCSMVLAARRGADVILVLGVSGMVFLPLLRLVTTARYIINVDGLEWRRAKWNKLASRFLRLSEAFAVRFGHSVISDNQAIVDHISASYSRSSILIPYGGDHAAEGEAPEAAENSDQLPERYALMLCRIEPENNVHVILESFASDVSMPLVAVGNWQSSRYGRDLVARYGCSPNIQLLEPIFEQNRLFALRTNAVLYVHGHSAGGTNPSLVEMMYLKKPVIAFDCIYNRYSTESCAYYFKTSQQLLSKVQESDIVGLAQNGESMGEIARRRYRWDTIGEAYFQLLLAPSTSNNPFASTLK